VSASRSTPGLQRLYLPPFRVDLEIRADVPRVLPAAVLARVLRSALVSGGAPEPASVGLVLADDHELARLNRTFLGKPGATDVLSFPLLPPDAYPSHAGAPERRAADGARRDAGPAFLLPPGTRLHLGDVVISVERAIRQAAEGRGGQTGDVRWAPADELRLLAVHGGLHLCGWDHAEPGEEAAMRALERAILVGG
jgi:probable rRNA maturation factor